ncbi:MAG TPA: TetR/AcrR family transcriptional regulator [Alphaproteobacteria bacterium]|nr:TetR/AcrR family transcriptional regulator [Alphaproteobacteria bacterium]
MSRRGEDTKTKILDAAQNLVIERGFAATPVDDIIKATNVTKGGFFHHFPSKAHLAEALLARYAKEDLAVFDRLAERAEKLSDDPLQQVLLFLSLFEEFVEDMPEPFPGCMFASYIYEGQQFGPAVHQLIESALTSWAKVYIDKFEALLASRRPKMEVTAEQLGETIVCIMEGAFLLARAYEDSSIVIRQSRYFREYLRFLFEA